MKVKWLKGEKKGQVEDIDLASALGLIDGGYVQEMALPYITKDNISEPADKDKDTEQKPLRNNRGFWKRLKDLITAKNK